MSPDLFSETSEFEALPDPERLYPVMVAVTERHLVWAEGSGPLRAARAVEDHSEPGLLSEETRYATELEVYAPNESDWRWTVALYSPHGPWRLGEPEFYRWRQLGADFAAAVEAKMAAAAAADPDCAECRGRGRLFRPSTEPRAEYMPCSTCRPGSVTR